LNSKSNYTEKGGGYSGIAKCGANNNMHKRLVMDLYRSNIEKVNCYVYIECNKFMSW